MKFSIRDLLWLMVVAALATGWFIDRLAVRRLAAERELLKNELAAERDRLHKVQAMERAVRVRAADMLSVAQQALSKAQAAQRLRDEAEPPKSSP